MLRETSTSGGQLAPTADKVTRLTGQARVIQSLGVSVQVQFVVRGWSHIVIKVCPVAASLDAASIASFLVSSQFRSLVGVQLFWGSYSGSAR